MAPPPHHPRSAAAVSAPFVAGRPMVEAALSLARDHGDDAVMAAQLRAAHSRAQDNAAHYCHWREVERLVTWMASPDDCATRH